MQAIKDIKFISNSSQEWLPGYSQEFPCITSRVERDLFPVPWHWHETFELFYVESGKLDYYTPSGKRTVTAGDAGLINADVLHRTKILESGEECIQLTHLFSPVFLSGTKGNRIWKKYLEPIVANANFELIIFDHERDAGLIGRLKDSFLLDSEQFGYELELRSVLGRLWLEIFRAIMDSEPAERAAKKTNSNTLKQIILYVQEHYTENITVAELAQAGMLSERECFRLFRESMDCTPIEYCIGHRLQAACELLKSDIPITEVGNRCGFDNSSYFSKLFKKVTKMTPSQYRKNWQDRNN